jgi:hypothetical protein
VDGIPPALAAAVDAIEESQILIEPSRSQINAARAQIDRVATAFTERIGGAPQD